MAATDSDVLRYLRAHLRDHVRVFPVERVPESTLRLDLNEGQYGPTPGALAAIAAAAPGLNRYPDENGVVLRERLAERHGVDPGQILLGPGSNGVMSVIVRACADPGERIACSWPGFPSYAMTARRLDVGAITVPLLADGTDDVDGLLEAARQARVLFLATPNNPTGIRFAGDLRAFCEEASRTTLVVVDEAYAEYADLPVSGIDLLRECLPVVTLRTFSKAWGLAGLRVGYGVMPARLVTHLRSVQETFEVSTLAQAAALASLDDAAEIDRRVAENARLRALLTERLTALGCDVYPSRANFVCARPPVPAATIVARLAAAGVLARTIEVFGDAERFRLGVPAEADAPRVLVAVEAAFGG